MNGQWSWAADGAPGFRPAGGECERVYSATRREASRTAGAAAVWGEVAGWNSTQIKQNSEHGLFQSHDRVTVVALYLNDVICINVEVRIISFNVLDIQVKKF